MLETTPDDGWVLKGRQGVSQAWGSRGTLQPDCQSECFFSYLELSGRDRFILFQIIDCIILSLNMCFNIILVISLVIVDKQ